MARRSRIQPDINAAQNAFEALRDHPYVQRVLTDEELRRQVLDGLMASRSAFDRASGAKRPGRAFVRDRKLQKDLRSAFVAAQAVQAALRESGDIVGEHRSRGRGRLIAFGAGGAALALAASGSARSLALDALFGKEEVFDYTPGATNRNGATPPPATGDAGAGKSAGAKGNAGS